MARTNKTHERANEVVEQQLHDGLAELERVCNADVITYIGGLVGGADDIN